MERFDRAIAGTEAAISSLTLRVEKLDAVRLFMDVKDSSRSLYLALMQVLEDSNKRTAALDDQFRALQNLGYREHRLSEEVRTCRDYACAGLDKVVKQGGLAVADSLGAKLAGEAHQRSLDMLHREFDNRQRLNQEREKLQVKKCKLEAEIQARESSLKEFPARLQIIKQASQRLSSWKCMSQSSYMLLASIPRPLALIYAQFDCLVGAGIVEASMKPFIDQDGDSRGGHIAILTD